jgi:cell division septum initiation protein DivIVA
MQSFFAQQAKAIASEAKGFAKKMNNSARQAKNSTCSVMGVSKRLWVNCAQLLVCTAHRSNLAVACKQKKGF